MNSSELQKRHSGIYESFFTVNSIVVSAPFLINRSWDIHPDYSGISIKQKLPMRLYVWIQKSNDAKIIIGNVSSYDFLKDIFEVCEGENFAIFGDGLIEEIIKKIPNERGGFTINILSEIPRTLWLGYNSILSLCLSAIIALLEGENNVEELIKLPQASIQWALEHSKVLNNLLRASMELDTVINGKMGASLKVSSFFDGYYPIVSFKDKSGHILPSNDLKRIWFYGLRMDEIRKHIKDISYPFDFWIIVSDKPILRENLKNINHAPNLSTEERKYIKTVFDNIIPEEKKKTDALPKFYRFLDNKESLIDAAYGDMMGAISMETLNMFGKVLGSYYSDEILALFFLTINKIRYWNNIVRRPSSYFLWFIDALLSLIELPSSEFAIYPNDTLIMGGTLTYASYSAKNRNRIQDAIQEMKKYYNWTYILYANNSDGIANKGLLIDQYIDRGIVSRHLKNNSWELKDTAGNMLVWDFSYLIWSTDYDLILDMFNSKIYFRWKKLTSQDLSSQSTTIEVLNLLFSSANREITNKEMPHSSYSKNKNELNSKIIVPLERRVKQNLGKDLVIKATGSLTNFVVYLKRNTIRLAFLDKKNP